MNKENYNRPVGGGLGVIHDPKKWEASVRNTATDDPKSLTVYEEYDHYVVAIDTEYDGCAIFLNPGLLLDLALAIVKKAKKDGIDVDRW